MNIIVVRSSRAWRARDACADCCGCPGAEPQAAPIQRPSTGARRCRSRCEWPPSRTVVQRLSRNTRLRMLPRTRARDLSTAWRRALPALNAGVREAAIGMVSPVRAPLASRARPDAEGPETGDGDGLLARETFADGGEDGAEHAIGGGPGERELRGQARSQFGLVHVLFPCDGAAGYLPVDAHRSYFRVASLRERRNGGAGGRVARRRRSGWSCPRSVTRCAGSMGSRETVEERCACPPGAALRRANASARPWRRHPRRH